VHTSTELRDAITSGTASALLLDGDAPFVFSTSIATAVGPTALLFNRSVVLVAPVGRVAVLDANAGAAKPRRVFTIVGAGVVVELRSVALTGGFSTEWGGGARVEAGAELRLVQSAVRGCVVRTAGTAAACGGGVLVSGGARLTALGGSRVSNNTAVSVNGYAVAGGLEIGEGGTAVLSASAVDGNTARAEGSEGAYGGGVDTDGALTARDGASISHNTAVSVRGVVFGGGITAANTGGSVLLNDSSVLNNTARCERAARAARAEGGGLAIFGSLTACNATIVGNRALAANGTCRGGGLFHNGLPALLYGGVIDANVAVGRVASGSQVLDWL